MGQRGEDETDAHRRLTYQGLLSEAQDVSGQPLARLRALAARFPAELPPGLVAQAASGPGERRGATRLPGARPGAAEVWPAPPGRGEALVLEESTGGVSLLLG